MYLFRLERLHILLGPIIGLSWLSCKVLRSDKKTISYIVSYSFVYSIPDPIQFKCFQGSGGVKTRDAHLPDTFGQIPVVSATKTDTAAILPYDIALCCSLEVMWGCGGEGPGRSPRVPRLIQQGCSIRAQKAEQGHVAVPGYQRKTESQICKSVSYFHFL